MLKKQKFKPKSLVLISHELRPFSFLSRFFFFRLKEHRKLFINNCYIIILKRRRTGCTCRRKILSCWKKYMQICVTFSVRELVTYHCVLLNKPTGQATAKLGDNRLTMQVILNSLSASGVGKV